MSSIFELNNGATVLWRDEDTGIVLAVWGSEFVTWATTDSGDAYHGHYFKDLDKAMKNYLKRIET